MTETTDIALRLAAATLIGMAIGLNRDVRGKPAGLRTMGLIALGAAMIGVSVTGLPQLQNDPNALSRVVQGLIQGVMAGIGFLGAGVMFQKPRTFEVHGMTTAAAIWATAALGVAAGLAVWPVFLIGAAITLFLLIVARPLEIWAERLGENRRAPEE